jgi:DNA primase
MGRFGDDKIEEVRMRADIVEIIGAHVRLKRAGRNFVGLCPFHNEKTPSFSVNAERGFFHCFGCGAGGSVFNFIMRIEGLNFPEAVRSLAQRYGVTLPEFQASGPGAGDRDAMLKANQLAAEFFAHVLWNTEDGVLARGYLDSRGITRETARAFMIGFAPARPASLAKALERRGLREAGVKLGLVRKDQDGAHDMFRARVMFPIRDAQGRVAAFGGRVLDARLPKYINSPESPLYSKARTLYGLFEARQSIASHDRAILVEGYFDAIALSQAGFKEVVAGCGTALTVEQLRILGRHTRSVIACFDGDEAGRKASLRALEIFLQAGLLGRGIFIPQGYDPDTLIRERGAQTFGALADKADYLIDYFLTAQSGEASKSLEGRAHAAQRVAEMLKLVPDALQFNMLARRADALGVGEEVLRRVARSSRGTGAPPRGQREAAPRLAPVESGASKAEIGLVAIALLYPSLRAELLALEPHNDFEDRELASLFVELCGTDETHFALEGWIGGRLSQQTQDRLSALAVDEIMDDETQARSSAKDFVSALDQRRRQREIRQNVDAVSQVESSEGGALAQRVVEAAQSADRRRRAARDGGGAV